MLYIDQIDDYSVRFSDEPDGAGNVKIVAIPVESRMEVDERIWMRQSSNIEHLLNNAELEDIVFNGETYLDAESLVVAMNAQLGALLSYSQRFTKAYGVVIDTEQANPDLVRIGNLDMAANAVVNEMAIQGTLTVDALGVGNLKRFNRTNGLLYEDGSPAILDGSNGNIMSYMPPFYYHVEPVSATVSRLWVSPYRIQYFKRHPGWCLGTTKAVANNAEVFGVATNSLWSVINNSTVFRGGNNDATTDALEKGFLGKPRTALSQTQFYDYAQNQGNGFGLVDYNAHVGMYMLFVTKYATLNSQKPVSEKASFYDGGLGAGLTTVGSTDWGNYNGYYPLVKTGLTLGLGLRDGEINSVITDFNAGGDVSVKVNSFLGIENPFGDIWEWTQGINIWKQTIEEGDKFLAYIYDNNAYEDSITDKYSRSFEFVKTQGGLRRIVMGEHFDLLGIEVNNGASSSTYFSDYFYNNTSLGLRGLLRGGYANDGSDAGLAYASTYNAVSKASPLVGSRLGFYGRVSPGL